ncbi:MAG: AsmA family protein, partial [Candidatus Hydrogenedentes bacterium]|nr:AsmA family protein [Candidatus Hydrogenedentota bacterium]
MKRRVKIVLAVLGGLVALLVILGLVVPHLIDIGWVREQIIQQAQSALGRDVRLGDVELRLIPSISVHLTDLEVAELEEFGTEPLVKVGRFYANVKLMPLLRKRIAIGRLVLVEPAISIVRSAEGKFNFYDIIARESEEDTARPAEEASSSESSGSARVTIGGIQIRQGTMRFLDRQSSPHTALQVDNLNVKVGELAPAVPIKFDVSADALGGSFSASGSLRPTPPLERIRANVEVGFRDIDLSLVKSYTKGFQSEKLSGEFTVALNDKDQTASWRGDLSLGDYAMPVPNREGASIGGAAFLIDGSASARYDLKEASYEGKIRVESLDLAGLHPAVSGVQVGSFEFDGKGSLTAGSTVVNVRGKATASMLSATAEVQGSQWDFDAEKLLLDVAAEYSNGGEKGAANATITFNLDKAGARGAGGKAYSIPAFRIDKAVAKLLDNEVSFKLPNVALGKTAFNGSGKVTLPEQGELAYDVAFDFGDVSLDELAGIVPDIAAYSPSGNLSLSVAAEGKGGQVPSVLRGKADFKNVSFVHPKIAFPIQDLVGTADFSVFGQKEFAKLTGLVFSMGATKVDVSADLNSVRVPKGSFAINVDDLDVEKLMPPKQKQAKPAARPTEEPAQPKAPAAESPLKGADLSG